MKQFKFPLALLFIFSILLLCTSCKKDSDDDDGSGIGDGDCFASWTVNGDDYMVDNMAGCVYLDNTLNLTSSIAGFGEFFLQIDPITSTGTYQVDSSDPNNTVVVGMTLNDGKQIGILTGTVTVSELSSSKAKGTFSGSFYDFTDLYLNPDFDVTDGVFEANF